MHVYLHFTESHQFGCNTWKWLSKLSNKCHVCLKSRSTETKDKPRKCIVAQTLEVYCANFHAFCLDHNMIITCMRSLLAYMKILYDCEKVILIQSSNKFNLAFIFTKRVFHDRTKAVRLFYTNSIIELTCVQKTWLHQQWKWH